MDKRDKETLPPKTEINEDNIPNKLKKTSYWGLWCWVWKDGQWTKVPVDSSGSPIDAKAFNLSFNKALKFHNKAKFNGGIGLLFTDQHDYYGIDYDDCVVDGKISKAVIKKIKKFDSYYEISVSGAGIHVMGSGASRLNGVDRKMVYSDTRYFTFTGNGSGKVRDISKLVNKYYHVETKIDQPITGKQESDISFSDLRAIIMNIRPDLSEPDWFLVCKAIHYKTGGSKKGWKLFYSWSKGEHCKKKYRYKLVNETPGQWKDGVVKKWNRCKDNSNSGMVGLPTLRRIESECPVSTKKQKKISLRDLFKKKLEIKEYLSPKLNINHLPKSMRRACIEVSRFNKVGIDPVATTIVMIFSAAINKKVKIIEREGLEHHCSLGCLIAMQSGGRKSAIDRPLMYPYHGFEKEKMSEWQKAKTANEQIVKKLKAQLKEVEKDPNYESELGEVNETQIEIMATLQTKINEHSKARPKYIESDATEERLSDSLDKNNEIMFIHSDDARNTIKNIAGRYDNGGSENIYIVGLTGDTYRRSRVKDDIEIVLHSPCLNVCLKVQLDLTMDMVSNGAIRESGLMARMFIKVVTDNVAEQYREKASDEDLQPKEMEQYNEALEKVLNYEGPTITVILDEQAKESRRLFSNEYADLIEGPWKDNADISNKIVSNSVKIATVIRIMKDPNLLERTNKRIPPKGKKEASFGPKIIRLSLSDYEKGRDIVKILMNQTLEVVVKLEENDVIKGAMEVLKKLESIAKKLEDADLSWTMGDIQNIFTRSKRESIPQWVSCLVENDGLRKDGTRYELI